MSKMYLTKKEECLTSKYLDQGYIIKPVANRKALNWIKSQYLKIIKEYLGIKVTRGSEDILNLIHQKVSLTQLNNFRIKIIREVNDIKEFRKIYFELAKPYLYTLVGNELAMQLRINLSIQLPGDDSSLLATHADTWSGDSPYEVVVWLPIVDCFGTKAMYILPPKETEKLEKDFINKAGGNSEDLYQNIKEKVKWLEVKYGEVLIFNQALPHGNRINKEAETRWSMNCRFKNVYAPYGDKKIGEFFEPITLRAASLNGMEYKLPKTS